MRRYTIETLPLYGKRPVVHGVIAVVSRGNVARAFRMAGYMPKGSGSSLIVRRSALTWELLIRPSLAPYMRLRLEPEELENDKLFLEQCGA